MSYPGKPCCGWCGKAFDDMEGRCARCGTTRLIQKREFFAEPDPAVREAEWTAHMAPFTGKREYNAVQLAERERIADAAMIEANWNTVLSAISRAGRQPEPTAEKAASQAEQAWEAVREQALSTPAFIGKAATEPEPARRPVDPWAAVFSSITNEQAGA